MGGDEIQEAEGASFVRCSVHVGTYEDVEDSTPGLPPSSGQFLFLCVFSPLLKSMVIGFIALPDAA